MRVVVYWRWCVFRWRRWSTRSSRGRARWRSWSRTWSLPTWSPSPSRRRRRPKPSLTVRYFSTEHWILMFFGELERLIGIHWFDQQKFCLALEPIIIKVVLRTCNLLYLNFPFTQYCPVSVFALGRSLVTYHVILMHPQLRPLCCHSSKLLAAFNFFSLVQLLSTIV